jgi:hypothetical protein
MRLFWILFVLVFVSCSKSMDETYENRYHVTIKDSLLISSVKDYVKQYRLGKDTVVLLVSVFKCPSSNEEIVFTEYTTFLDFVYGIDSHPSYHSTVDGYFVVISTYMDGYFQQGRAVNEEIRRATQKNRINLKAWDGNIYDPPLWKTTRINGSITKVKMR